MKNKKQLRANRIAFPLVGLSFILWDAGALWAQPPDAGATGPPQPVLERVKEAFGLRQAALAGVELRHFAPGRLQAAMSLGGRRVTIDLQKHSVRAAGYRVMLQHADGSMGFARPGPVYTYRGSLRDSEGSLVAASFDGNGLHARVFTADGDEWWLEPVAERLPEAARSTHVVYRSEDLEPPVAGSRSAQSQTRKSGRSGSAGSHGFLHRSKP